MSIDIGTAFGGALERLRSTDGLIAMGLLGVLAFLRVLLNASTSFLPTVAWNDWTLAFVAIAVVLFLVAITSLVQVLVFRLLYNGGSGGLSERVTRRVGLAALWLFLVNIAVGLAVMVGLVLFVIPGIILAAALILALPTVAIEDVGPLQALDRGWSLASGNRVELIVLGIVHVGVAFAVGVVTSIIGGIIGIAGILIGGTGPAASAITSLISGLIGAAFTVPVNAYFLALLVESYDQVSAEGGTEPGTTADATTTDRLGSIGD